MSPVHGVEILQDLFVIFLLAKLAGELMTRLGQPPVIGELLVGVAIGPHAFHLVDEGEVLRAIAELGVVFLLFEVGLENRFSDLRKVGGTAAGVAVSGVVVPFVAGFLLLSSLGRSGGESAFLGAAMVATSVGVTARVLADLGLLRERESRVILGAAVIDDVLGLLVLAVVAGAARGTLSPGHMAILVVEALFFLVFAATVGTRLMRRHGSMFGRIQVSEGPFVAGVVICLGFSALAGTIGLAAIVGAFLAGMVLAETREQFALEKRIEPITNFLTPFFFVLTGMAVDFRTFVEPSTALLGLVVFVLAAVTKFIPCALASARMGRRSATIVGAGMIPRGEVGIIVASIGLASGVFSPDVYSVVVAMSILTTLVVPPLLRPLFGDRVRPPTEAAEGGEPFGAATS
jgi:Kef-type K+ transport system membrane component KefB